MYSSDQIVTLTAVILSTHSFTLSLPDKLYRESKMVDSRCRGFTVGSANRVHRVPSEDLTCNSVVQVNEHR